MNYVDKIINEYQEKAKKELAWKIKVNQICIDACDILAKDFQDYSHFEQWLVYERELAEYYAQLAELEDFKSEVVN